MPPILPILIIAAVTLVVLSRTNLLGLRSRQRALPPGVPGVPGSGPAVDSKTQTVYVEGGYDPSTATRLAAVLAADLSSHGSSVDPLLIRAFQASAGIAVDGKYGPETRGALGYWLEVGGSTTPPPGSGETAYSPPDGLPRLQREKDAAASGPAWPGITGYDPTGAAYYAPLVAESVQALGKAYRNNPQALRALRSFQLAAGIVVDGLYGPESHGALTYWLRQAKSNLPVPKSLFGVGSKTYRPRG